MARRFDIAFSFAGEQRDDVVRLDAALQRHFPVAQVFYDRRHEHELAGTDFDARLYELYRHQAELVVACLSADYAGRNWTLVEGRAIGDLMLQQEDARVVLLRFDQTPVRPIPDTAHFIDFNVTPLDQIVAHIVARHARVVAHPPGPRDGRTVPLARPRSVEFTSIGTLFKGRADAMERLRASLLRESSHATAIVAHQAIHGEGGVGKTRLALEFGLAHQAQYSALLFVQADNPDALRANLAELAGPLALDLGLPADANMEVRLAEVLKWLDRHPGWFLILDNVDSEAAAREVEKHLANLRAGHVVITSRIAAWSESVEPLELDVLSEEASVDFLLEATARRGSTGRTETPDDADQARRFAGAVDGLALALEQSAAYIRTTGTTIEKYRARWAAFDEKVRGWHDPRLMKYPRSVAVTWESSFEALPAGAAKLLRVCALLAAAPIPMELLEAASSDLDADLAPLLTYSLAKRDETSANVRVHRLIQEVAAQRMTSAEQAEAIGIAGAAMSQVMPTDPDLNVGGWALWARLVPHVPGVAERLQAASPADTGRLLNQCGIYHFSQARYAEAEPLMRRALAIDEAGFGKDHPRVARDLNNLATLLQATNRLSEAEPRMRRALAIDEAIFGKDHPNVAIDLNNLAQLLQATNRLSEAEPLMRRALAIDEASYGRGHADVARDLNNLATLLKNTNRLSEAEPLMRRALAIAEASNGRGHPKVAIQLNNLAQLLKATNRLSEAEPLMRRALAIDEASYGRDHPTVATDLNNLAQLLQDTNRLSEAEPLMRRALAIDEASYGRDHPDVARDLNNLAQLLQDTNRLSEAEPLMRRALAIDEASYGRDHPDVARDLNNLAQLLQDTNRLSEAEPLMRRALAIDEAGYGRDHPKVAIDLNNLAQLLQATNRLSEAEPLMWQSLEIFLKFTKSTGHLHPHLRAVIDNYAGLLHARGAGQSEIRARLSKLLAEYGLSLE